MLIIAAAVYGDRNINISHSIFRATFKMYVLYYISFLKSTNVENIF